MLEVKLETGQGSKILFTNDSSLSILELWEKLENRGLLKDFCYILQNGRLVNNEEKLLEGSATVFPRLIGGKGGFGSMLRAIGAQIEKTTNREACRDLSGRRLRDINEEKRLKAWIEQQGTRDEKAAERKKKKLERLCAEPKHEFKDKNYEHERSVLAEKIDSAVEEGFKIAMIAESSESVLKTKETNAKKGIKRKTLLDDFDEDIDSDELSSSDEETEKKTTSSSPKKKVAKESSDESTNDSGCFNSEEQSSSTSHQENDEKKTISNNE